MTCCTATVCACLRWPPRSAFAPRAGRWVFITRPTTAGSRRSSAGRGGFYSYDRLENLVGCNIHSSNRILLEWQDIKVGDEIRLAPEVGLVVAFVEQGRSLVLRGGIPMVKRAAPYDFTWAFTLREEPDETTRLLVRERYMYTRAWARLIVEPTELLSFAMSQKMLRGIRDRAERTAATMSGSNGARHPLKAPQPS
jgi:hypothetical protein